VKKIVYLGLALLLPGLVFVFLKYAGSNRFDIPIYYEDGIPKGLPCAQESEEPYQLPDSISRFIPAGKQGYVFIFPEASVAPTVIGALLVNEIGQGFTVIDAADLPGDSTRSRWHDCVFLLSPPSQSVLVDGQRRIRGYYDLRKRDEMDRLRVELKILLEKY
jgi:hypothetical protein